MNIFLTGIYTMITKQLMEILIALDQLLATVLGLIILPFSHRIQYADESFSALCYRIRNTSKYWYRAYITVNAIFFWQPHHCETAYESEKLRRQLPEEYR